MPRLAVLGGTSPFTAGLFDAIASSPHRPPSMAVRLYGRNQRSGEVVASYGRRLLGPLGWDVEWVPNLARALDGIDVVLQQIRFGGLEGRQDDEDVAAASGLPADETIGPGGLQAAIRTVPPMRRLTEEIKRNCPAAVVLNLTNPLSVTTAVLASAGVRVIGLCELPLVTARAACSVLGLVEAEVQWAYSGFNHRGFVHHLEHLGRDRVMDLSDALGHSDIEGVTGTEIAVLEALPTKYFALFRPVRPPRESRAARVTELRQQVLEELATHSGLPPPSLAERAQPWYQDSVVPVLGAITRNEQQKHVVNLLDGDVVREVPALVSAAGAVPCPVPSPPPAVVEWILRFECHERRVLAAADDPSKEAIRAALEADPAVPPAYVAASASALDSGPALRARRHLAN